MIVVYKIQIFFSSLVLVETRYWDTYTASISCVDKASPL